MASLPPRTPPRDTKEKPGPPRPNAIRKPDMIVQRNYSEDVSAVTIPDMLAQELRDEDAEASMLSNIESRASNAVPGADGFTPAVPGERAPLGAASLNTAFGTATASSSGGKKRMSFADVARRVQKMQQLSKLRNETSQRSLGKPQANGHRRVATLLASIDEDSKDDQSSSKGLSIGDLGNLINTDPESSDDEMESDTERQPESNVVGSNEDEEASNARSETLPLLSDGRQQYAASPSNIVPNRRWTRRQQSRMKNAWLKVRVCCHPVNLMRNLLDTLIHSFLIISIATYSVHLARSSNRICRPATNYNMKH